MGKKNKKGFKPSRDYGKIRTRSKILIFSEGKETEQNYFKGWGKIMGEASWRRYDLKVRKIGTGNGTDILFKNVLAYVDRNISSMEETDIWILFDNDDHSDDNFNSACALIEKSNEVGKYKKRGIHFHAGWSNPCFELWLLNHFDNPLFVPMTARDVQKKLSDKIRSSMEQKQYRKNDSELFYLFDDPDMQTLAIENSKKQFADKSTRRPAAQNPCTRVYELVEVIKNDLETK